jgi:hypothetical protein
MTKKSKKSSTRGLMCRKFQNLLNFWKAKVGLFFGQSQTEGLCAAQPAGAATALW